MAAQPKSSTLNLYDKEAFGDDYKFRFEVAQARVDLKDMAVGAMRPLHFKASNYKFEEAGADFDLIDRFSAVELKAQANEDNPVPGQNAANIAAEGVSRAAQDVILQANIDAEVARAAAAENVIQTALDTQEAKQVTDDQARQDDLAAEVSNRQSAVASETAARNTAIQGLQSQISNILSNADATALNSLSEIVTAFQNADNTLTGALATLQSSFDDLKARVDVLTDGT